MPANFIAITSELYLTHCDGRFWRWHRSWRRRRGRSRLWSWRRWRRSKTTALSAPSPCRILPVLRPRVPFLFLQHLHRHTFTSCMRRNVLKDTTDCRVLGMPVHLYMVRGLPNAEAKVLLESPLAHVELAPQALLPGPFMINFRRGHREEELHGLWSSHSFSASQKNRRSNLWVGSIRVDLPERVRRHKTQEALDVTGEAFFEIGVCETASAWSTRTYAVAMLAPPHWSRDCEHCLQSRTPGATSCKKGNQHPTLYAPKPEGGHCCT